MWGGGGGGYDPPIVFLINDLNSYIFRWVDSSREAIITIVILKAPTFSYIYISLIVLTWRSFGVA